MAQTLAAVPVLPQILSGRQLCQLLLLLLFVRATMSRQRERVPRENAKGHDQNKECGAKQTHLRKPIRGRSGPVKGGSVNSL